MAAYGLYTHISSNKVRSMLLLAGLFLLIYVLVFAGALVAEVFTHGGRSLDFYLKSASRDLVTAFPYATAVAALWIVIAYFFHQNMIDAVTGGESVTRQQQPRLYNLLENLCISRGIPMPKLKVMESPALNAFASGLNRQQYAVTVTTGLLAALDDQEIEAVLGHELTHIRNGDVQLMVVAVIIAGVVGFFGELMFRMFTNVPWSSGRRSSSSSSSSSSSDRDNKGAGGAILAIIIAVALILIAAGRQAGAVAVAGISGRRRFGRTDQESDAMISALRKIENRGELPGAISAVMELCVDNPREGFADLFATHPSVENRVKALVQYAGGHDPGPLALPADAAEEPEVQGEAPPDQLPPPVPRSPWSDGNTTAIGPIDAPPGPPEGPWGRRS